MSAFFDEIHARYGDPHAFVARLRSRMQLHNVPQGRLAERSGFHPTHVSRWLGKRARVIPEMGTMVILDEALERIINGE